MSIDIYQTCPCHSGKKIKFCCGKDIIHDLNEIINLTSGKQLLAALDHIDRTIEKTGVRDCLLALKTHILLKLGEWDRAQRTNEEFVANNPNYSIGHQHRATLFAAQGDIESAIRSLQDALDYLPGDEVPVSLANGFRLIGMALLKSGDVFAARAHLRYALQLKGGDDEELNYMMLESYRMPWPSLLLKEDPRVGEAPVDQPWSDDFVIALRLDRQAQWRAAIKKLSALNEEYPNEPVILQAIAAMYACLANREKAVEYWQQFARCENADRPSAVEAEILAQYFDDQPASATYDLVNVVFEIPNVREVLEKMADEPKLINTGPVEFEMQEGPPPQAIYVLLDREELQEFENLTVDDIPQVSGNLLVFGKQTDREARVETYLVKNDRYDDIIAAIADIVGTSEHQSEKIDEVMMADQVMSWDWHLPPQVSPENRRDLMTAKTRQTVLELWPEIPFAALDMKTPNQVVGDANYAVPLTALAQRLSQQLESVPGAEQLINELMQQLKLEAEETIDPQETDLASVSAIRQRLLKFEKLDDEQLYALFTHAMMIGNMPVLRNLIPEALNRPQLTDRINFSQALTVLARVTVDNEQALEHLKKARQLAIENGEKAGTYLVMELDLRLERGISEKCEDLVREIQMRHMNEPDVEMMLVQVLSRHGLIHPDGRPVEMDETGGHDPMGQPAAPAESSGLWTPDSGETASGESGGGKLWIPGAD